MLDRGFGGFLSWREKEGTRSTLLALQAAVSVLESHRSVLHSFLERAGRYTINITLCDSLFLLESYSSFLERAGRYMINIT